MSDDRSIAALQCRHRRSGPDGAWLQIEIASLESIGGRGGERFVRGRGLVTSDTTWAQCAAADRLPRLAI